MGAPSRRSKARREPGLLQTCLLLPSAVLRWLRADGRACRWGGRLSRSGRAAHGGARYKRLHSMPQVQVSEVPKGAGAHVEHGRLSTRHQVRV